MQTVTITHKDVQWLVREDGQISVPSKTTACTRTRDGVVQTYIRRGKQQPIRPCVTKSGYFEVSTMHNGKRIKALVHRLVGFAFVLGYEEGLTINHINGIKTDNRPDNLEWVSLAQNTKHQWQIGLVNLRGDNNPQAKLTSKQVLYMRRLMRQGVAAHQLAVIAGVSDSLVYMIQKNQRWTYS